MCVALLALDAVVHTSGPRGERAIPLADFHALPGSHPERESVLEAGEIVTHVSLENSELGKRSAYVKARDRASYAFALASAAAGLELEGTLIRKARVALGGVASKPWRCPEVELALIGKPATAESFSSAATLAMREAKTTSDNQFKVELARRVIARALTLAGSAT
jgi:xanthine dehydrogenase YagS FAD-binding subunit